LKEIPREKGTYALVVRLRQPLVMRLNEREVVFARGLYVYAGSAFGPGGLRARISRHLSRQKRRHWHIDELTSALQCKIMALIFCISAEKLERAICGLLSKDPRFASITGFGSSDDPRNPSHLFLFESDFSRCVSSCGAKYIRILEPVLLGQGIWIRNLAG